MDKDGAHPDIFTFATLLKGIKNPGVESIEKHLVQILDILNISRKDNLIKPDEILLNSLIDVCFKFGDHKKAMVAFNFLV